MSILLRFQVLGGHTHIDVFVGKTPASRGRAGTLVLQNYEWEAIRRMLPATIEIHERVIGDVGDGCPPGCRSVTQRVDSSYCGQCRARGLAC